MTTHQFIIISKAPSFVRMNKLHFRESIEHTDNATKHAYMEQRVDTQIFNYCTLQLIFFK